MCLLAFAIDSHPRYRLVLAANRDEDFTRPAAPAGFWDDAPQILAGRDLEAGGTWLGVSKEGRLAALTNYLGKNEHDKGKLSRGRLVSDYLSGDMSAEEYLRLLDEAGDRYNGFGLVFGDAAGLSYYTNRGTAVSRIAPGLHGLSNHLLDTPWPKVAAAKEGLGRLLQKGDIDPEDVFALLADRTVYPDHLLPDTDVAIERERALSAAFVAFGSYGTRCSTVILVDREDRIRFLERSFDSRQQPTGTVEYILECKEDG